MWLWWYHLGNRRWLERRLWEKNNELKNIICGNLNLMKEFFVLINWFDFPFNFKKRKSPFGWNVKFIEFTILDLRLTALVILFPCQKFFKCQNSCFASSFNTLKSSRDLKNVIRMDVHEIWVVWVIDSKMERKSFDIAFNFEAVNVWK